MTIHLAYDQLGGETSKLAMFWSAHVFSKNWQRRFLVTIEPFERNVISMLIVTEKQEAALGCKD